MKLKNNNSVIPAKRLSVKAGLYICQLSVIRLVFACILCISFLFLFASEVYAQNQHIDRAIYSLYASGSYKAKIEDWPGALSDFEKAYRLRQNSSEILVRYSEALMKNGRIAEAEKMSLRAIDYDTFNADAYLILAEIALSNEELNKADKYLKKRLELKPDDLESRIKLGLIRETMGNIEGVIEAFKGYPALKPGADAANFHLGIALTRLKRYREAIKAFKDALRENPKYTEAAQNIAVLYEELESDSEAIEAWKKVLEISPDNADAFSHIITLYVSDERFTEAANTLQELVKKVPDKKGSLRKLLVQLAIQSGDVGLAARTMNELAKMTNTETGFLEVAFVAAKSGTETDVMISALKNAWNIGRRPAIGLTYLQALIGTGRETEAEEIMTSLDSASITDTRLLFTLALLFYKMNNETRSIEIFEKVILMDTFNAEALNFVGYSWAEKGINLERAEEYIRRALSVIPNHPQYIDSLGWIFYQKGLYDIARLHLEKAYQLMKDEPEIMEHLGDVYEKLGRSSDAVIFYKKALDSKKNVNEERIKLKLDKITSDSDNN